MQAAYNWRKSYAWNYEHGPLLKISRETIERLKHAQPRKKTRLLGYRVNAPVGVAAGPLLNARWIQAYARLGFDVLTYKTVRSRARASHPLPNILFLHETRPLGRKDLLSPVKASPRPPARASALTITNSFGMPSKSPRVWTRDVAKAKKGLLKGQVLAVSVAASPRKGDTLEVIANDYAWCARRASKSGADIVEFNLSCPNVTGAEGGLYQDPKAAAAVAAAVREAAGKKPVVAKLGYYASARLRRAVVDALAPHVQGLAAINTLPLKIYDEKGRPAMPGKGRLVSGVCGNAIRRAGLQTVRALHALREQEGYGYAIIGVGGVMAPAHALAYLDAGADCVQTATAAMWDPLLAVKIKEALQKRRQSGKKPARGKKRCRC